MFNFPQITTRFILASDYTAQSGIPLDILLADQDHPLVINVGGVDYVDAYEARDFEARKSADAMLTRMNKGPSLTDMVREFRAKNDSTISPGSTRSAAAPAPCVAKPATAA